VTANMTKLHVECL